MNMEARIKGIGMTSVRTRKRLIDRLKQHGINNDAVLDAMLEVPRHMFVDEAMASRAYEDCSLPIGEGQTISQPYVVALMTQLMVESVKPKGLSNTLEDETINKVLEVGTGSGYQAAVLSKLVKKVFTVERIRTLAHRSSATFRQLGMRNVNARYADGYQGWAGEGPFDAILVTAAMDEVPDELLEQLRPGGVLVGPVGPQEAQQKLTVTRLRENGKLQRQSIATVRFVPFLAGTC